MCQFFSLVSDGNGKCYYLDAIERGILRENNPMEVSPDSHTYIAHHFGFKGKKEDKLNKWEYNPITQVLIKDQINAVDDFDQVEKFCKSLDFKTIVPELNIKPIVNALCIKRESKFPTKKEIRLLKKWDSVWASAWDSVRDSVGDSVRGCVRDYVRDSVRGSVRDSVGDSVGDSVWASVWDSVWASAWDSVRDSVGDSVWASVWDSVRVSVLAYTSSYFILSEWRYCEKLKYKKGTNPFQCCIDLWYAGLVPSFNGKIWRLHTGLNAEIVYEWEPKMKGE
jgi:hypothetical protein